MPSYRHAAPHYIDDNGRVRPLVRHRLDGPAALNGKHRRQHGKVYIFGSWGALLACVPLAWTILMLGLGIYQNGAGGTRIIPAEQPRPPAVERIEPAPGRSRTDGGHSLGGTTAAPGPTNQPGSSSTDPSTPTTGRSTPTTDPTVAPDPGTAAGQTLPTPAATPSCMPKPKKPKGKPSGLPNPEGRP